MPWSRLFRRFLRCHLLALAALVPPCANPAMARPAGLLEPSLHVAPGAKAAPQVAVTLDACMGQTDQRILDTLLAENIKATIFVTARWIRSNPQAVSVLKSRPDLFEVENHGENHVPPIDRPLSVYGIAAAGSPEAVAREVSGGAEAIIAAGFPAPRWFRGATALYTPSSMAQIRAMGFEIAGFSINGDSGSLLGANAAEKQFEHARDGDVLIAHINQPTHAAGEGVAAGLKALKARGLRFVLLKEAPLPRSPAPEAPGSVSALHPKAVSY
ncbi:polysaccharide deacetylase family protein [Allorhizobium undicola]|uniref:polysaccharide deacetylase family protein n=1 Tax=Allorhizobium undicola TaxID=78527 RepID=UPI000A06A47E|nr:polysaccharide deacetylase family protein [Allorhizobium undicola]